MVGRSTDAESDAGPPEIDPRAGVTAATVAAALWVAAEEDLPGALARATTMVAATRELGTDDPVGSARVQATLGHLLLLSHEPQRAAAELRAAVPLLEGAADDVWLARALGRLAVAETVTGHPTEGLRTAERAVALAHACDTPGMALLTLSSMGATLLDLGDPLGAIEQLAAALALADEADRRGDVALVLAHLAEAFQAVGDLPAAERYAELAVVTADQDTAAHARFVGRLVLATTHQARGDHAAAIATAEAAEALGRSSVLASVRPQALLVRMASLRALGRAAEAVAAADAHLAETERAPTSSRRAVTRERLLANLDLGAHGEVIDDAERILSATESTSPMHALAYEALAEVARRKGDHRAEAHHLRRALDAVRTSHQEETTRRNLAIRTRAEVVRAELAAAEQRRRTNQLQHALEALERDRADLLASEAHRAGLIAQLERLADEDPLTGLPNRRRMERAMLEAPATMGGLVSFALVDVDHFKQVNDKFGHPVGDRVLARLARLFARGTRPRDVVARVGGEEFAILMADEIDRTIGAVERLRGVVADEHWGDLAPGLVVTVSIGLVPLTPGETLDVALGRADRPLYAAKAAGRDRVAVGGRDT